MIAPLSESSAGAPLVVHAAEVLARRIFVAPEPAAEVGVMVTAVSRVRAAPEAMAMAPPVGAVVSAASGNATWLCR